MKIWNPPFPRVYHYMAVTTKLYQKNVESVKYTVQKNLMLQLTIHKKLSVTLQKNSMFNIALSHDLSSEHLPGFV